MPQRTFRFGSFELDERSGELRKHGVRIRLQEQPFQILLLLLDAPGKIVTRGEIRGKLWPPNTFVDFDSAISSAVRKLREALGDNADRPRFIETLPRRGYRFIALVDLQLLGSESDEVSLRPGASPELIWLRIRVLSITACALLLFGLVGWLVWSRSRAGIHQPTPVPLTAAEGSEDSPSFSPDGNQIAYTWADPTGDNIAHIYIKTIGSGRAVPVTGGTKPETKVSWSPDGRTIAFRREQDENSSIYLMPPAGGLERRIRDGSFAGGMSWSHDSRFLAVAKRFSQKDNGSLFLISVENGDDVRLTRPPDATTEDRDPMFSPDGRSLLFTRCRERYTCGLYLLKISSDNKPAGYPTLLVDTNAILSGAAWAQDGKAVIYSSCIDKTYNPRLMQIRMETGAQPEPLSYTGDWAFTPVIAAQGNRMAYVQNLTDFDLWQIQPGKPPRMFASSTRDDRAPQYSPDGRHVVFQSNRSGSMNVWLCDSDGKNPVQLTNSQEFSGTPRWSPDSKWIAFDRHLKTGWHIFTMASDGGNVRQLTYDGGDEVIPSWSRDGKWIYFASNRTGSFEIWKAPSSGGNGHQVTHHGGWVAFEAPDGHSLYYTKVPENLSMSNQLWQLPADGNEERLVAIKSIYGRAYTVTDDGIYYIPVPIEDGQASIRLHHFGDGKEEQRTLLGSISYGVTVSPDRSSILTVQGSRTGSNVMVVDNVR